MLRAALPLALALAACAARGYEGFRPPAEAVASLRSGAFDACVDGAAGGALDMPGLQVCHEVEAERLDALLEAALAARGGPPPADQARWRAAAFARCDREHPFHDGWGWSLELQQCQHDEVRRRILWLRATPASR